MMCGNDFLEATHLCSFPLCFLLIKPFKVICMVPCKINKVRSQQSLLSCWRQAQATLITSLLCASVSLQHHKYMQTKCRCFHQNISLHIYTFFMSHSNLFFLIIIIIICQEAVSKVISGSLCWNSNWQNLKLQEGHNAAFLFSFFLLKLYMFRHA